MPAKADYGAMIAQAGKLYDEAEELLAKGADISAEEIGRVEKLMQTAESLKERAVNVDDLNQKRSELLGLTGGSADGDDEQPKLPAKGGFKSWGHFLAAVHEASMSMGMRKHNNLRKFRDVSKEPDDVKDMTGQTGTGGGYLIPADFLPDMMAISAENGIVRSRATVIPMRRRQVLIPVLNQTGVLGAGLPNWFGGMQAYWADEGTTKTETNATFKQVVLTAHKIIMFTQASDELLDDSAISLAAFLSGPLGFSGAIQWMEDFAFLMGNGINKPMGVVNAPATLVHNRDANGTVIYADLVNMVSKLLPGQPAVWVISQSVMPVLMQLSGPSGNPSYIWGSAVMGAPSSLLGYPVVWTEKLPALGTKGDVGLYSFPYYLIGDRQATTVESTKFGPGWQEDLTSWRAVHRVDGRPWLEAPLTYQDGVTQVSPFVTLDT